MTKDKQSFTDKLDTLIRSRSGLVWISTKEEYRAEIKIAEVAERLKHKVLVWRSSVGLFPLGAPERAESQYANPNSLVQYLYEFSEGPATVILEDVTPFLNLAAFVRYLKDLGRKAESARKNERVQIIVVDSADTAEGFIPLDLDLPDREELITIIDGMLAMVEPSVRKELDDNGNREDVIDALTGLEAAQAQQALAQSLTAKKRIDVDVLIQSKKALISGSAAIDWIDPDPRGLDAVGGLSVLKRYLGSRRKAFRKSRVEQSKLPQPKAILAAGIPGTGKSLTAKAVASAWQLPLLRFDVGAAFGKYVGESEKGLKRALKVAEAVAPAILWIDEIEKGLAGASGGGDSDGGTTVRVFGELLTWMQETTSPIYVVATSNDPTKLPPELFRAGRFDAVWWVDVPNSVDRIAVLEVMIQKYDLEALDLDLQAISEVSDSFTGAELEQAIVEAMWTADEADRDPTTEDVVEAAGTIRPVVVGWGEQGILKSVRQWAKQAARPANDPEESTEADRGFKVRKMDLDD